MPRRGPASVWSRLRALPDGVWVGSRLPAVLGNDAGRDSTEEGRDGARPSKRVGASDGSTVWEAFYPQRLSPAARQRQHVTAGPSRSWRWQPTLTDRAERGRAGFPGPKPRGVACDVSEEGRDGARPSMKMSGMRWPFGLRDKSAWCWGPADLGRPRSVVPRNFWAYCGRRSLNGTRPSPHAGSARCYGKERATAEAAGSLADGNRFERAGWRGFWPHFAARPATRRSCWVR